MTDPTLTAELRLLEEQLLLPDFRRNRGAVSALLAEGFVEYGTSGRIFTKSQILDLLSAESPQQIDLADFAAHLLSPEVALVTYRTTRRTEPAPPSISLRSSLWIRRGARWQLLFHQGTPVPSAA